MIIDEDKIKVTYAVDPAGKISSGMVTATGTPKSLDYFNVSRFPRIVRAYGDKPKKLVIAFPKQGNIEDFFFFTMKDKGIGGHLKKVCNKKEFLVYADHTEKLTKPDDPRLKEVIKGGGNYMDYKKGKTYKCPNTGKCKFCNCKGDVYFYARVIDPADLKILTPMHVKFACKSVQNGNHILTMLREYQYENSYNKLYWIIRVEMRSGVDDRGQTLSYPIWLLEPKMLIDNVSRIQIGQGEIAVDETEEVKIDLEEVPETGEDKKHEEVPPEEIKPERNAKARKDQGNSSSSGDKPFDNVSEASSSAGRLSLSTIKTIEDWRVYFKKMNENKEMSFEERKKMNAELQKIKKEIEDGRR